MRGIDAYRRHASTPEQRKEALIRKYAPLVRKVAYRLIHRLPASVEIDDLISVGTIGLLHAIDNFDESRGKRLEQYAEFRIKGAMIDELRSYDFMSRAARGRVNKIERTGAKLETRLGRAPTREEVAVELGLGVSEVEESMAQAGQMTFLSAEDLSGIASETTEEPWELLRQARPTDPFGHTFFRELREQLIEALDALPERLKLVMSLYYYNSLNFKEIGLVLDVSESRISQLHTQAVGTLRKRLKRAI